MHILVLTPHDLLYYGMISVFGGVPGGLVFRALALKS